MDRAGARRHSAVTSLAGARGRPGFLITIAGAFALDIATYFGRLQKPRGGPSSAPRIRTVGESERRHRATARLACE